MHLNTESIASAASEIERLHRQADGSTYSLHLGNLQGHRGFCVSPYPDRLCKLNTKAPSRAHISDFIRQNADLLVLSDFCIGTWVNENDETEMDVVRVLGSEFEALITGLRSEQRYVFDLENGLEIRVSVLNLVRALFRDRR